MPPIGPVFSIEQVQRNVLLELGDGERGHPRGLPARVLADLNTDDRERVRHSLFLGIERRSLQLNPEHPSANDGAFLVRNLIGVDPRMVLWRWRIVRPGMNVQFQLRETDASRDEALTLLREAASTDEPEPVFGLLMACLGRGQGLFGIPDGDVSLGRQVMPDLPMAGAFCNGEIGPVAGSTHLPATRPAGAAPAGSSCHCRLNVAPARQSPQPFFPAAAPAASPDQLFERPEQPIHLDIGCARAAACSVWPNNNRVGTIWAWRSAGPWCSPLIATPRRVNTATCGFCSATPTSAWKAGWAPYHATDCNGSRSSSRIPGSSAATANGGCCSHPAAGDRRALEPGRELFLQSDVREVIEPMVALTELSGCLSGRATMPGPWRLDNPLRCRPNGSATC